MATNQYTSSYTLDAVRRRGLIPSAGRLSTADMLGFVNDAMNDFIVPMLMAARENFLQATEDTTLTNGRTVYPFPARAAVERLIRVALVDSAGEEYPLDRVETPRKELGTTGFELVDNSIVLVNVSSGYTTLRVTYYRMPNRLVVETDAGRITAVTATTVTLASTPSTFSTSEPMDVVSGTAGFRCRGVNLTPTGVNTSTNVITFASGIIPSAVVVGDYPALAGETPVVQCPVTLRPLLEQAAACIALEALGDNRVESARRTRDEMEKRLAPTLAPRVTGAPRVVVNRYSNPGAIGRLPQSVRRWR